MSAHPLPYYQVDVTLDLDENYKPSFTVTRFTKEEITKTIKSYNALGYAVVENYREGSDQLPVVASSDMLFEDAVKLFARELSREFSFMSASDEQWLESGKNMLMRMGLEWKWD